MRVALYTFGLFRKPADDPVNQGFFDRNDASMAEVEAAPGFIARSGYDGDPGPDSWGEQVWPRFYVEKGDGWSPATLSLWRDPGAIAAFAYRGVHGEAVRMGREWFQEPRWPPYVIWWVAPDHVPNWHEGVARNEQLHRDGPGPQAFMLATPFGPTGNPVVLKTGAWLRNQHPAEGEPD